MPRIPRETLLPGVFPAIVGSIARSALRWYIAPESWLSLLFCGAAGAIAYSAVLLASCLRPRDKEDIRRLLAKLPMLSNPE